LACAASFHQRSIHRLQHILYQSVHTSTAPYRIALQGVYAIARKTENWFLDGYKSRGKNLRIRRHQFPVAPDYARTAYSCQGFTLPAAIVDLNFDKRTDPVTGYVALSRVRTADDILIRQPFSKDVFQQGVADNADILMAYLRGEDVDELLRPRRDAEAEKQAKKGKNASDAARAAQAKKATTQKNKNATAAGRAAQAKKGRTGGINNNSEAQARKAMKHAHPRCSPECPECHNGMYPCSGKTCNHKHQPRSAFDAVSWDRKHKIRNVMCRDSMAQGTRKSKRGAKR